jgi:hypothetical protein
MQMSSATSVVYVVHAVVNATKEKNVMSEPQLDDDIALGKDDECADCNEHMSQCTCTEPDRMYGDED